MRELPKEDQYFHIYNRGAAKAAIFFKPAHWLYFLHQMKKYFTPDQVDILAYCLMPNHFHLVIYTKHQDFGRLVMMPFLVSYTRAVNRDMRRVGTLFQGQYQTKQVQTTEQLMHLSRYIHRNPVSAGLCDSPEDWKCSSFLDYIGLRQGTIVNTDFILSIFSSADVYRNYVSENVEEGIIHNVLFNEK
jgi:putative transposase